MRRPLREDRFGSSSTIQKQEGGKGGVVEFFRTDRLGGVGFQCKGKWQTGSHVIRGRGPGETNPSEVLEGLASCYKLWLARRAGSCRPVKFNTKATRDERDTKNT